MKYMGSKARIAKHISPIINRYIIDNHITTYVEPFVGGANMIEHIECKNKYGLDSYYYNGSIRIDIEEKFGER